MVSFCQQDRRLVKYYGKVHNKSGCCVILVRRNAEIQNLEWVWRPRGKSNTQGGVGFVIAMRMDEEHGVYCNALSSEETAVGARGK